ncbi:MAG: D-alanine-D-alanine ligase [Lentisphaeria bacterium]|jgi:D-alanine-D-alanine ligase
MTCIDIVKKFESKASHIKTVAVLYGGLSAERAISLQSGLAVIESLTRSGIKSLAIDVGENVIEQLMAQKFDIAFIALHGSGGEDGKIQALLEIMRIPYTGSGVAASALAMNKLRTKQIWQAQGLLTPDYRVLSEDTDWQDVITCLGGECFVKPAGEGSSLGMHCVDTAEALRLGYLDAECFDKLVLAERLIRGREFTVSILNGVAFPTIELSTQNKFYDYEAKYISNDTRYICPCDLSGTKQREINALAELAFSGLGCKGWGRVDIMQGNDGEFYLLEVNTVPGMTSHSLVPMSAKAAGLSFEDLVKEILASAV